MRRNTVFCNSVHFPGSYLYLKRHSVRSYNRCMKRLIHIRLRHCYIILKTHRHRSIHLVYHTQYSVAVLYSIYYNSYRKQVIQLIYRFTLGVHLSEYTVEMLCAPHYTAFYTQLIKLFAYNIHYIGYIFVPRALFLIYAFSYFIIRHRIKIFECKIFKLYLYLGHTESMSKGRIDVKRFL